MVMLSLFFFFHSFFGSGVKIHNNFYILSSNGNKRPRRSGQKRVNVINFNNSNILLKNEVAVFKVSSKHTNIKRKLIKK